MVKKTPGERVLAKLKSGKATLYFGEGCPACEQQIEDHLQSSYGKIRKLKGAIDVTKGDYPGINSVPTWVNKFGEHSTGSQDPKMLLKHLDKSKHKSSFGSANVMSMMDVAYPNVGSNLNTQPQPNGYTEYGWRGGALPCSTSRLGNWEKSMHAYQNYGDFTNIGRKNLFGAGGLLKRPYGPSDNYDMKGIHGAGSKLQPFPLSWNYQLGQFGKSKRKKRSVKRKKRKKRSVKRSVKRRRSVKKRKSKRKRSVKRSIKRKFGSTPGSKAWKSQVPKGVALGSEWVNESLAPAKGYNLDPIQLYLPVENKLPKLPQNLPMQYSNNQLNDPQPSSLVRNFGRNQLTRMEGPNNVAHRPGFDVYTGAGGNTIDFFTGDTYLNSQNNGIQQVQKSVNNPTGWLSSSEGIKKASSGFNTARSYTNKGLKFGSGPLVYTRDNMSQGAKTLYQPLPPYMRTKVTGDYATRTTRYGSKATPKTAPKATPKTAPKATPKTAPKATPKTAPKVVPKVVVQPKKPLMTQFGGKTITLAGNGKISISGNQKN
jgi:hypothetical protein